MTLPTQSGLLGLDDVKIFEVIHDEGPSEQYPQGRLDYGSAVDVAGMQNIDLKPNYVQKQLMQDEEIDGVYQKLKAITWAFANAKVSLDALNILEGGTITSETTPTVKHTFTVSQDSEPKYFKLEGKIDYSTDAIGDFHLVLYKCKALDIQVAYRAQNYAIVSAAGIAIPTVNNSKIRDYVMNETATTIS